MMTSTPSKRTSKHWSNGQSPSKLLSSLNSLVWFRRLGSGIYAFFFAPNAFLALGLGVTSLEFEAAVGQPLSSSEGFVSLVVGTFVLCTIAIHDGFSIAGTVVTLIWSVVIGIIQLFGVTGFMTGLVSDVDVDDSAVTMQWGLYPVAVMAICLGTTIAAFHVRYRMRSSVGQLPTPPSTPAETANTEKTGSIENQLGHNAAGVDDAASEDAEAQRLQARHQSVRNMVTVSSLLLTGLADVIYLLAAPDDTLMVAAHGLKGLSTDQGTSIALGLLGAIVLCITAYSSAFSSVGPIVSAAMVMVLPWYFVYPMWASLTGNVAKPGAVVATPFALGSPVITALGLVLAALTFGVFMTRRNVRMRLKRAAREA